MHVDPSLTIHVTEARGSDSAGLHTGSCQAPRYWVMTHFPHFNLGENSPQRVFFFSPQINWARIYIKRTICSVVDSSVTGLHPLSALSAVTSKTENVKLTPEETEKDPVRT